jgi:penicillin-binding protein 1C
MEAARSKQTKWWHKKRFIVLTIFAVTLSIAYYFSLPDDLFVEPSCTVVFSKDGVLMNAAIATDGQWRFPESDSVPEKFATALIAFEDKRFNDHPGVDLLSMGRAMNQNLKAGRIVSGGSTITMQVIRLSRKEYSRTFFEKIVEIILATRLECKYSKSQILNLYASHAPFGGNVVGLDAACWRYFGTDARDLSWAQAAMLAVLPNSPALIHPGRNRTQLKKKRDRLLEKLAALNVIDRFTCELSMQEEIPEILESLPRHARHLQIRIKKEGFEGKRIISTLDHSLQQSVEAILESHHEQLEGNQIHNGAAIVLEVQTGNVLAYAGNVNSEDSHEAEVDIIESRRSSGSILKPFLYAAAMDEGKLLPAMLLPDVPVVINGFTPKNFSHAYDGAVHADRALIRSLNVPAVHLLQQYRYEKFYTLLKGMGMTTLDKPADHYGLSLILGGAEVTLWDVTAMYASMARTLNHYFDFAGTNRYLRNDYHSNRFVNRIDDSVTNVEGSSHLSAASVFLTFETLTELTRPGEESGWRHFSSSRKIAWKTGTSFGFRDGWAVGITPEYIVGVWVGNADGEGRPGLTGTDAAAPIMFDIFSQLPQTTWFQQPQGEMQQIAICKKSGYRFTSICEDADTVWVAKSGLASSPCPFHKVIHLTQDGKHQVHDGCASVSKMKHMNWFVLPPVLEFYYRLVNISYKNLPPLKPECADANSVSMMDMIYPKNNARIFIPRELDGTSGSSVFQLAHRNTSATVFWHLDGKFVGTTVRTHHLSLNPGEGEHTLTAVDEQGKSIERKFTVISKF